MPGSFRIGKIAGIDIDINVSWIIVLVLLTVSLATGWFPQLYPGWSTVTYWVVSLISALLLFVSVRLHELAHSLTHPPTRDHLPGKFRDRPQIVLRASSHPLRPKGQFFRRPASQSCDQARHEFFPAGGVVVLLGHELRHSQALPSWEDRDTLDPVSLRQIVGHQRVSRLVKCDDALLRFRKHDGTPHSKEHP